MIRPEQVRAHAIAKAVEAYQDSNAMDVICTVTDVIDAYERALWQPVSEKEPPLGRVLVGIPTKRMSTDAYEISAAHFAQDLSGEEQPPFRGWYRPVLLDDGRVSYFSEVHGKPAWWRPEPPQPGEVKK